MPKEKHAGGRPTKYKPEYCQGIIDFFTRPLIETDENGKKTACDIPLISDYALSIDILRETLWDWTNKYPEFSNAYKKAKDIQRGILVKLGMKGLYNPSFSVFAAKNMIGWRDKHEIDMTGKITIAAPDMKKDKDAGK